MPQGRHKTPFSGKQKKEQMVHKRNQKRHGSKNSDYDSDEGPKQGAGAGGRGRAGRSREAAGDEERKEGLTSAVIAKINAQPERGAKSDANRYALHFFRETEEELEKRKEASRQAFEPLPPVALEVISEDVFPPDRLGIPKRPFWDSDISPRELEKREQKQFREYLESLEQEYGSLTRLSHFELNLETWRQLWRVLEMADMVLLIADIRHPIFHFPPALYNFVTKEMKKEIIVVLNKADLVPAPLVLAWMAYFKKIYPQVHVTPFASYAGMKIKESGSKKGKRIGKLRMASESAKRLYAICQEIAGDKVDLSNWLHKIERELKEEEEEDDDDLEDDDNPMAAAHQRLEKRDLTYYQGERYKDGIVTIGCVGHPNVGKSSVLNALMGKKVVSVSRTPGHTKYFQTIFITPTVKLCDCPGLVFPSKIPKAMQVLMGCFPIAQLREPYSAVGYLAQRLDVPKILNLRHPNNEPVNSQEKQSWSAYDVCEAWALKRGFFTAKAARPDVYRAANHMMRMALDGRTLCLAFYPTNYVRDAATVWQKHPDVRRTEILQCQRTSDEEEYFKSFVGEQEDEEVEAPGEGEEDGDKEDEDEEEESLGATVKNKFALLADSE